MPAYHRRKHIVQAVREQAPDSCMRAGVPGADCHVETFIELCEQGRNVLGPVLPVAVHHHEYFAACCACAGFYRGAVTQ